MNKRIFLLFIIILMSCSKEPKPLEKQKENCPSDSEIGKTEDITSGAFWNMAIGSSSQDIYKKIQDLSHEFKIETLGFPDTSYSNIESIGPGLNYYNYVMIADKSNIQYSAIYFYFNKDGELSDITNWSQYPTEHLRSWPPNAGANSIDIGDKVNIIYDKLIALQGSSGYKNYFTFVAAGSKFLTSPFDERLERLPKWGLFVHLCDNIYQSILLEFSGGKLVHITSKIQKIIP